MKTNILNISLTALITILLFFSCSCDKSCADVPEGSGLGFSCSLIDTNGNNITHFYDEDTVTIHTLNYPDSLVDFSIQSTVIRFSVIDYKPYIGDHDMSFLIYWEHNDTDTLRIVYTVEGPHEHSCYYTLISRKCYFNGKEAIKNPQTSIYELIKE